MATTYRFQLWTAHSTCINPETRDFNFHIIFKIQNSHSAAGEVGALQKKGFHFTAAFSICRKSSEAHQSNATHFSHPWSSLGLMGPQTLVLGGPCLCFNLHIRYHIRYMTYQKHKAIVRFYLPTIISGQSLRAVGMSPLIMAPSSHHHHTH